ncbi:hypothetical protein GTPT_0750 [Tatumella ptyseos ATCC 33301]|uniref:Uncharacterized protein n=1 Tax=Tatumella ptyseos ATCC 33301 TaxID=1005995 RepID=A0A085JMF5_9GAMM|nr:hypothetical protein GTPT_0750 [Tatumella ptyseos ATCC 33301]
MKYINNNKAIFLFYVIYKFYRVYKQQVSGFLCLCFKPGMKVVKHLFCGQTKY